MRIVNINAAFILFVKIESNTKRVETKSVCKQTPYQQATPTQGFVNIMEVS